MRIPITRVLAGSGDVSQLAASGEARLLARHATELELLLLQGVMEFDLLLKRGVAFALTQPVPETTEQTHQPRSPAPAEWRAPVDRIHGLSSPSDRRWETGRRCDPRPLFPSPGRAGVQGVGRLEMRGEPLANAAGGRGRATDALGRDLRRGGRGAVDQRHAELGRQSLRDALAAVHHRPEQLMNCRTSGSSTGACPCRCAAGRSALVCVQNICR
jgi:hypothetical protein